MSEDDYDYRSLFPNTEKLASSKRVTFLLGTDRHLDEGTDNQETRVGIIPLQASALRDWLVTMGVDAALYMVKDAGIGSGYSNEEYVEAGVNVVEETQLPVLSPPDVVHALKEPSHYEGTIPGYFMRLGALHTGDFEEESGLAALLKQRNFCAIFDGSSIGGFSYKLTGGYRIPIKSSMSVFAGNIAADMLADNLRQRRAQGRIVICGGGVVGISAVKQISAHYQDCCAEILLVEANPERCEELVKHFSTLAFVHVKQGTTITPEDLESAGGLVLATATLEKAPKVIDVSSLAKMEESTLIIDVSSDEGGSVLPPETGETVTDAIKALGKNLTYIADKHMPRRDLHKASREHGKAVLPYLGVLLYLSAREGGSIQGLSAITKHQCEQDTKDHFDALMCDLRNGLAITGPDPIRLHRIVRSPEDITTFLDTNSKWHRISYEYE